MKKAFLVAILLFAGIELLLAQDKCECCTYNSFDQQERFETLFPPSVIQKKQIKSAVVHTTEDYSNDSTRYIQCRFEFNQQGFVTSRKWYNRGGKPHSIYTYERNDKNLITKVTFSYLDSNENIANFSSPEIIDYVYDQNDRLILMKNRDYNGKIQADELSQYTSFKYERDGKLSEKTHHFYWEWKEEGDKHDYNVTTYSYVDKYKSRSVTKINNELWLTSTSTYDDLGNVLDKFDYNVKLNSPSFKTHFQYNQQGQITYFKISTGKGGGTECPDGSNFQEKYTYTDDNLIKEILHQFEGVECVMVVGYE